MAADVFLSYAREDVAHARSLVGRLHREGWTVFWDHDLRVGRSWPEALEVELTSAGCAVVLWSTSALKSRWVLAEADLARERKALIPARLQDMTPPPRFGNVHACDLTGWDLDPDASDLRPLVDEIAALLGRRRGASLDPVDLSVVIARPSRYPNEGHVVNLSCDLRNSLDRAAELRPVEASATWPDGAERDLSLRLLYDPQGFEHRRRVQPDASIAIPAGGRRTGVQLSAPMFDDVVQWPEGRYRFQIRGWVNRDHRQDTANLRTTFAADLDVRDAWRIAAYQHWSDERWVEADYSDDAVGVPLRLSAVRMGQPAA